jgi:hypothetical protein
MAARKILALAWVQDVSAYGPFPVGSPREAFATLLGDNERPGRAAKDGEGAAE